jgi:hypothetical protein
VVPVELSEVNSPKQVERAKNAGAEPVQSSMETGSARPHAPELPNSVTAARGLTNALDNPFGESIGDAICSKTGGVR